MMRDYLLKKTCTKCKAEKDIQNFGVDKQKKDGVSSHCKECVCIASKKHYENNVSYYQARNKKFYDNLPAEKRIQYRSTSNAKDSTRIKQREWQRGNVNKVRAYSQKWYAKANPEVLSQKRKEYRKLNPEIFARHSLKRSRSEKNAMPSWLSDSEKESIRLIYLKRDFLNEVIGVKHEVDHIFPLQGRDSCGLHVPWNLQVITSTENRRKNNSVPSYA